WYACAALDNTLHNATDAWSECADAWWIRSSLDSMKKPPWCMNLAPRRFVAIG
ncbi:MAG: hypothetical protein ACI8P0_005241, partial [Planctomycetaceae bacterium]